MSTTLPIIVVGGGTAGCTVVSYLASHSDAKILLIEPGGRSSHDDESRFLEVLKDSDLIDVAANGYVQGRAIGGGSAVNGMLLTGAIPEHIEGLTRVATDADAGQLGRALFASGGRFSRLWWNRGRWNPGRAVHHLQEEGRITILSKNVTSVIHDGSRVTGVRCGDDVHMASLVVMCAGAIATPAIILSSGLSSVNSLVGVGLQNHPTITAFLPVHDQSDARFDACVVRETTTHDGAEFLTIAYERVAHDVAKTGMLSISLMNPKSRGSVSIGATGELAVNFALLEDVSDLSHMIDAVHSVIDVVCSSEFASLIDRDEVLIEGSPLKLVGGMSDTQLGDWVVANVKSVSHASSSCAKAVDSSGQLKGIENCWIADASVLSGVPACTPAAPVTMEALRIARKIGESLS